jgi:hypothetical protein
MSMAYYGMQYCKAECALIVVHIIDGTKIIENIRKKC